ncbi:MAG: hypothetical protein IID52_08755 [Proteobacteria bacterium]|nr:hypothetical protein [Pseudomonadota bacterium]
MSLSPQPKPRFPDPDKIRVAARSPLVIAYEGRKVELIAKPGPRIATLNECAGLLTARALGLPALEGWLVPGEDRAAPLFATTKETIQTLKEAGICYDDDYWERGVKAGWFRQAFVFDTLTGNYDRVLRNMCFRGAAPGGPFVFMDHDKIFFRKDWNPEDLFQTKGACGHNNLTRFLGRADAGVVKSILAAAQAWQKAFARERFDFLDPLKDFRLAGEQELRAMKGFLSHRMRNLTPLVYAHLNSRPKT